MSSWADCRPCPTSFGIVNEVDTVVDVGVATALAVVGGVVVVGAWVVGGVVVVGAWVVGGVVVVGAWVVGGVVVVGCVVGVAVETFCFLLPPPAAKPMTMRTIRTRAAHERIWPQRGQLRKRRHGFFFWTGPPGPLETYGPLGVAPLPLAIAPTPAAPTPAATGIVGSGVSGSAPHSVGSNSGSP